MKTLGQIKAEQTELAEQKEAARQAAAAERKAARDAAVKERVMARAAKAVAAELATFEPPTPVAQPQSVDEAPPTPYVPPLFDYAAAKADPEAELASRELCRRRLLPFIQRFRPKYTAGWVHADICRRFERFLRQVEAGEEPRLLLMMPPRSGKSEISSRHYAAWVLGQHPDWEIIAASHTSSLTMTFSRYLRDLMNDPAYHAIFPDAVLDPNSRAVENWNLTRGGGYLAAGVGTGITGRGAHILLLDDLVKDIEAADSLNQRDNTWEWYISTAYTRLAPGGGVLGLMCMTGDTSVLMADGTQRRLDTLKESDAIATYKNGALKTSRVAALRSSGRDLVYKITTSSGKIVRANQRHPFLTIAPDGELIWTRVRSLTTDHRIVALPDNGVSGKGLSALPTGARSLPSAEGCVLTTTTRSGGLTGIAQDATITSLAVTHGSNTGTELQARTTTRCMPSRVENVPSAGVATNGSLLTGKTNSLSTTATTQEKFAACSATTVMRGLDTLELSLWHLPQPSISDFTAEQIVSIQLEGEEEVFDVQVDDTENFIANGLVSHNTWWHADDWAGRIQQAMDAGEGDRFEIVKYPAINDAGDEYLLLDDSITQCAPQTPVPAGARITRPMGTAIHPERYSTEAMLRIKRNAIAGGMKRTWDALYQQNPIPDEGNYFSKEMFRYYSSPPPRGEMYVYQAWDFAISEGKTSDYTVGVTIGVDHRDACYVLDVKRFKSSDGILIANELVDYAVQWGVDGLGFEDGQIWKAIETMFLKACEEKRNYPAYEVLKPLTDKMVRASPLRGRMQAGKVYFDDKAHWFREVQKEMLHFPAGKHDDQCFVAGTLISMGDGSKMPIEKVCVGDMVLTPRGPRQVLASGQTSASSSVYALDEFSLVGTGNHPVYTANKGFVPLSDLTYSDILHVRVSQRGRTWRASTKKRQAASTRSSSTARFIAAIQTRLAGTCSAITRALAGAVSCIVTCGSMPTGQFQMATSFTTSTETHSTTSYVTLPVSQLSSTTSSTLPRALHMGDQISSLRTLRSSVRKLLRGIALPRAWFGTRLTERRVGKGARQYNLRAESADRGLSRHSLMPNFAGSPARTETGTNAIRVTKLPRRLEKKQPVFNLTVDDAHCYYANGVLVHNCDALAWCVRLILTRMAPRQKAAKKLPSWKDALTATGRGESHMAA